MSEKELNLNINKEESITIKPVKDSWNREEVIWNLFKCVNDTGEGSINTLKVCKWIEENL